MSESLGGHKALCTTWPDHLSQHLLLRLHIQSLKSLFFPQSKLRAWEVAFENYVYRSQSKVQIFDVIKDEYEFALDNIDKFETKEDGREKLTDFLGHDLFTYAIIPLRYGNHSDSSHAFSFTRRYSSMNLSICPLRLCKINPGSWPCVPRTTVLHVTAGPEIFLTSLPSATSL